MTTTAAAESTSRIPGAVLASAVVGVPGGLIGLGGAEFRLPILIGIFGVAAYPPLACDACESCDATQRGSNSTT